MLQRLTDQQAGSRFLRILGHQYDLHSCLTQIKTLSNAFRLLGQQLEMTITGEQKTLTPAVGG